MKKKLFGVIIAATMLQLLIGGCSRNKINSYTSALDDINAGTAVASNDKGKVVYAKDFGLNADSPDNTIAINTAIAALKTLGSGAALHIEQGTYKISSTISLTDLENVNIDGHGANLIFTQRVQALKFEGCKSVKLQNITIDYNPLPFTQGIITNMDPDGKWYEVKVDEGYPCDMEWFANATLLVFPDPQNIGIKVDAPNTTSIQKGVKLLDNGILRVECGSATNFIDGIRCSVQTGDSIIIYRREAHAITLKGCGDCTFNNITIYAAPQMAIVDSAGEGGSKYLGVKVIPGPKPDGAVRERLFSANADAYHAKGLKKGPILDGCTFLNMGDDGVNIFGGYFEVGEVKDKKNAVIVAENQASVSLLQIGDQIEIIGGPDFILKGQAKVSGINQVSRSDLALTIGRKAKDSRAAKAVSLEVSFDKDIDIQEGDLLISVDRIGNGSIVRNCTIGGDRARGVIFKCRNGIIENNTITRTAMSGILILTEIGHFVEGHFPADLIIQNNKLINCGLGRNNRRSVNEGFADITVKTLGLGANNREIKRITIKDNIIENSAMYSIMLLNTSDCEITGNKIINSNSLNSYKTGEKLGLKPNMSIFIGQSEKVKVEGNTIQAGQYCDQAVFVHDSCDKTTITLNENSFTKE